MSDFDSTAGSGSHALLCLCLFLCLFCGFASGENLNPVLVDTDPHSESGYAPTKDGGYQTKVHSAAGSLEEIEHRVQWWGLMGMLQGLCTGFIVGSYVGARQERKNLLANAES
jgi:hypothetical protein